MGKVRNKKSKKENVTSEDNPIQQYIDSTIDKVLEKREIKLKEEDAKQIIQAILPEIEKIVANVVLKHFRALAVYVQQNLRDPEEK